MKDNIFVCTFVIGLVFISLSCNGPPECGEPTTLPAYDMIWPLFETGCQDSAETYTRLFQLNESDWKKCGYSRSCDINQPYAKFLTTAFFLRNGLSDAAHKWHGTIDYRDVGQAVNSKTHDRFYYLPSEERERYFARTEFNELGSNRVFLSCVFFDNQTVVSTFSGGSYAHNNPASLAGEFIHEGWHNWQWTHHHNYKHQNGKDRFFPHKNDAFGFGELWKWDIDAGLFHSPNQVQIEYLCDLALYGQDWIPNSILIVARSEANHRINTRFTNAVGYVCGEEEIIFEENDE